MRNRTLGLTAVWFTTLCSCSSNDTASPAASAPASAAPSASASSGDKSALAQGTPDKPAAPGEHVAVFKKHALPDPSKPVAGFAPSSNGFKFQNYGNDKGYTNLTSLELRRMFGDQVCGSLEGEKCTLTPQAEQWMAQMNKGMGGGHCEGLAALSLLMQRGQIDPGLFGSAKPIELEVDGNDKLQREVAYWFVTQAVMPMAAAEDKSLTPSQIADKIAASLKSGTESFTLGIYGPGYTMGHATTPYDVVDKENGITWILHYDNNYPGEERHIEIDRNANTWAYTTAADPNGSESGYKGDAESKTLTIAPSSVRTGPLTCGFCGAVDGDAGGGAKGSTGAPPMREIMMSGDGNLLISDDAGKRLGYADGKFVHEIPDAVFAPDKSGGAKDDEPDYFLPIGHKLKVELDGAGLTAASNSDVVLVGPGYTLGVEGIGLDGGQKDEIDFSADWSSIRYTTKKNEVPTILLGIETSGADYTFEVKVAGDGDGQIVELGIDVAKGFITLNVDGGPAKSSFTVDLERISGSGSETFTHKGMDVGADEIARFDFAAWKGNKTPLHVSVTDAKGAVIEQEDAADDE